MYEEARKEYVTAKEERKGAEQRRNVVHHKFQPLRAKLQQNEAIVHDFLKIEKVRAGASPNGHYCWCCHMWYNAFTGTKPTHASSTGTGIGEES